MSISKVSVFLSAGIIIFALNTTANATDFGGLIGQWKLTQGGNRCDGIVELVQSGDEQLDLPNVQHLPQKITLGKFKNRSGARFSAVSAKLDSNELQYRSDWGEYCAAPSVSVRTCMYWGIEQTVFALQSKTQLIIQTTQTTSGNSETEENVCNYIRVK